MGRQVGLMGERLLADAAHERFLARVHSLMLCHIARPDAGVGAEAALHLAASLQLPVADVLEASALVIGGSMVANF